MKQFNEVWTSPITSDDEGGGEEEDFLNEEDTIYPSGLGTDIFSVSSSRFHEKPDELDKEVMESIRQFSHERIQWWIRSQQEKPIRFCENVFSLQKLPTWSSILSSFENQDASTTSHLEHEEESQKETPNHPTTESSSSPVWSVITPPSTTTLSIDQIMKEEQTRQLQRLVMEESTRSRHHHKSSFRHQEDHRRRRREDHSRQSLLLSSTNHHFPSRPSLLSSSSSPISSSTMTRKPTVHEESQPRLYGGGGGNKKWELLCIREKHHDPECRFAHSFEEWNPKKCKYQKKCSRKDQCCFWHAEIESKRQYLIRTLRGADGYFRKHRDDYIQTYRLRM